MTRTVSPGSPTPPPGVGGACSTSVSSSSSAPGPVITMCDWPSSPIIWFIVR
jgi:hypothetical protein